MTETLEGWEVIPNPVTGFCYQKGDLFVIDIGPPPGHPHVTKHISMSVNGGARPPTEEEEKVVKQSFNIEGANRMTFPGSNVVHFYTEVQHEKDQD